jgi:hypothetical protein
MDEDEISVRLEVAAHHQNMRAGAGGQLWSRVGNTNFTGTRSVITYLDLNPGLLKGGETYRIADLQGSPLMNDVEIRAQLKKSTAKP